MARKIRVTYLWTDESVMHRDFQKGISRTMTEWANEFYARYGFELDVDPPAPTRSSVTKAAKYALRKTDGVRPEVRDGDELAVEETKRLKPLIEDVAFANAAYVEAKRLSDDLTATVERLEASLARARVLGNASDITRLEGEVDRARERRSAQQDETSRLFWVWYELDGRREVVQDEVDAKLIARKRLSYELREQMSEKWLAAKIGSATRVSIVFCQWAGTMDMRNKRPTASGATYPALSRPTLASRTNTTIWPFPFAVVALSGERRTVAHELVHAITGHDHPNTEKSIVTLKRRISGVKEPAPPRRPSPLDVFGGGPIHGGPSHSGSILGGSSLKDLEFEYRYVEIAEKGLPGGYEDGAPNDIMSYVPDDPDAKDVILRDSHKAMLDADTRFVK